MAELELICSVSQEMKMIRQLWNQKIGSNDFDLEVFSLMLEH